MGRELYFVNKNYDIRDFHIYVEGKKLKQCCDYMKRVHSFTYNSNKDRVNVKIIQKHPCESYRAMISESLFYLILDFIVRKDDTKEFRARYECDIDLVDCNIVNIDMKRQTYSLSEVKYEFIVNSKTSNIDEKINEFESPEYLKRRYKMFKIFGYLIPILMPIALLIIILISANI
ncbi:MAG: hypothetical protein RSA01_00900 [Clostridium sp.]|uniref:hypothetical protein n=1 Tax=Clostridium sp. TaxID=1506 RepID=UPI002FC9074B